MLHLVDIAFLFTSVESLRPERRKRANIESQSRRGGGGGYQNTQQKTNQYTHK